jgi:small-conductance mechanosensitive channel/CRP-like cAMP-binding protein
VPVDFPFHAVAGAVLLLTALAVRGFTSNRVVRNRLQLTLWLAVALLLLDAALRWAAVSPGVRPHLESIARLLFVLGVVHTVVLLAVNPLRADRMPERFPTIVQDALVIGIFLVLATLVLDEKFLTTSAVGAVVIGFALQDTLGNMFSGLAIQVEKPFRVGHWIRIGDWEGAVAEVTWRATKLRTKQGNLVVVPNSELSKQAITNYSEPAAPTRLFVDVGASYSNPPNQVKDAIHGVLRHERLVLASPPPEVWLLHFADSAITYRAEFWIADFPMDDIVRDRVRTSIYYEFQRRRIEIPFPIQVQYTREEVTEPEDRRIERLERLLLTAAPFAPLSDDDRRELARMASEHGFGAGEAIVREGEPGASAFVVSGGSVRVTIGTEQREVSRIAAGGYFGEMSLLTGDPRSATVSAETDCRVVEITADDFRRVVLDNPAILDVISTEVARRRAELAAARSAAARSAIAPEPAASLLSRVRRFLLRTT